MKKYTQNEIDSLIRILGKSRSKAIENYDFTNCDLSGLDLREITFTNVKLRWADLSGADLYGARIRFADLLGANLANANLKGVDLHDSNLRYANLRGANLKYVNLTNIIGNNAEIKSMLLELYYIAYTSQILQIRCKNYSIDEWRNFSDKQIDAMDEDALTWWKKYKELIFKIIELNPTVDSDNYKE